MLFSVGRCSIAGLVLLRMALLKKLFLGSKNSKSFCYIGEIFALAKAKITKIAKSADPFDVSRSNLTGPT